MLMRKSKHVVPELCRTVILRKKNKIIIRCLGPGNHTAKTEHTQVVQMIPFLMPQDVMTASATTEKLLWESLHKLLFPHFMHLVSFYSP